jgi:hypothetical protein
MTISGKPHPLIRVQPLGDDDLPCGNPITFVGRESWAMRELIAAGERGVSSLHHIGPRLAHYCMKIRRAGLLVDMVKTPHSGPYSGWHGVYVLKSKLAVVEDKTERAAA